MEIFSIVNFILTSPCNRNLRKSDSVSLSLWAQDDGLKRRDQGWAEERKVIRGGGMMRKGM